jgi:hypothetical protein
MPINLITIIGELHVQPNGSPRKNAVLIGDGTP